MIFKLDHLACTTTRLRQQIQLFQKFGYEPVFVERDAVNMPDANRIMQSFSPHFNFSLLACKENTGIEILDYHHTVRPEKQIFFPIFENPDEKYIRSESNKVYLMDELELVETTFRHHPDLIFYRTQSGAAHFAFNRIIVKTSKIDESVSFYKQFRFQILRSYKNWIKLEFVPLLHQNRTFLYLIEEPVDNAPTPLDSAGFHKIAFISNSLENDRQLLEAKGYFTTPINPLMANNQELNIFFCYGPSSELVEFVSIGRQVVRTGNSVD